MSSRGHRIRFIAFGGGYYQLSWIVDRKYRGRRLRFPHGQTRDTDERGARRFARRWKIPDSLLPEQLRARQV